MPSPESPERSNDASSDKPDIPFVTWHQYETELNEARRSQESAKNPKGIDVSNAKRPSIEDMRTDYSTLDRTLSFGSASIAVFSAGFRLPLPGQLVESTISTVNRTTIGLRQELFDRLVLPGEEQLGKLGWKQVAAEEGKRYWTPPDSQKIGVDTTSRHSLVAQRGLPDDFWRRPDGSVLESRFPFDAKVRPKHLLTPHDMDYAAKGGLLKADDAQAWRTVSAGNKELDWLAYTEQNLPRLNDLRGQGLVRSEPINCVLKPISLQVEMPLSLEIAVGKHNAALSSARQELAQADKVLSGARTQAMAHLGIIAGAQVSNYALDRTLFANTPTSCRTAIVDMMTPFAAMTKMNLAAKYSVMVGGHLAARLYDDYENKGELSFSLGFH
jgi:hypothetical protein